MDAIQVLGSAMGVGLLAGFRLYATVLALGLALRFKLLELSPPMSGLEVLADGRVLAAAALGFVMEFAADKIPWVDSLWDAIHTLIRPAGAALLAVAAAGSMHPLTQVVIALLAGGIAFSGHSAKAATRLVVNHSPEPFSNIALSMAGDLAVPAAMWVAFEHPRVMRGVVAVFLALFLWLSPKVFRAARLEVAALRALLGSWFSEAAATGGRLPEDYSGGPLAEAAPELRARLALLPAEFAKRVHFQGGAAMGVPCAAGRGLRGLGNSKGYLGLEPSRLVFLARRAFRLRTFDIPLETITACRIRRGILLDRLILATSRGGFSFYLFKTPPLNSPAGETVLEHSR
mgnify:CR=1 FL=1